MKHFRITIEPISPESIAAGMTDTTQFESDHILLLASSVEKERKNHKELGMHALCVGDSDIIASGLLTFLQDNQHSELRNAIFRAILENMQGKTKLRVMDSTDMHHRPGARMPDTIDQLIKEMNGDE